MELEILRRYFEEYTSGVLSMGGIQLCYTIELPWKDNQRNISCIPEGRYPVQFRKSIRFKDHLWIRDVPGRSLILMHPANDAIRQLKGCIAPVMQFTGGGKGSYSRIALNLMLINLKISTDDNHFITIKS